MIRTGNVVPVTPIEQIQGYLDFMGGKEPQTSESVYMAGYDLAKKVKEGVEEAPIWATPNFPPSLKKE